MVHCYNPSQDTWTTLPPLPVVWIGLGQINGKFVTVGGLTTSNQVTNELYTYDKMSHLKWKQTFPPMPTARRSPSVLSLQSALLVVGGVKQGDVFANEVEILKLDVMQWCKAAQIPVPCAYISLVAIGSTCYALGGSYGFHNDTTYLKQALYTSIDDLLSSAVAVNNSISNYSRLTWKSLPDTPRYVPTAAVLIGRLLAIGGGDKPKGGADMKEVYMYSDTAKCWMYISDLPAPRANTTNVALSATEILIIGGYNDGKVNSVYKGTLQIEP